MRFVALLVAGFTASSAPATEPKCSGLAQPAITNVHHEPAQPRPNLPVLVTAQIPDGAINPVLKIQAVAPGKYVRKSDTEYEKDWTDLPMQDDGKDGDQKAGDGVYTVRVPASYQRHRWLLRYRISATDAAGKAVIAPAIYETCPNFA